MRVVRMNLKIWKIWESWKISVKKKVFASHNEMIKGEMIGACILELFSSLCVTELNFFHRTFSSRVVGGYTFPCVLLAALNLSNLLYALAREGNT